MKFLKLVCSGVFIHGIWFNSLIVMLSSLPNIRRLTWGCREMQIEGWEYSYSRVFHLAAAQLSSISSPCQIIEVTFHPVSMTGYEKAEDHCKIIDEVLTSDNFPSLRRVLLLEQISFDYFPLLQSRKLLGLTK